MQRLPPRLTNGRFMSGKWARTPPVAGLLFAACLLVPAVGCVHLDTQGGSGDLSCKEVAHLVATWNPEVIQAADPTKQGAPNPGLTGRVYMFGQEQRVA
jgi:hypothetical protein